MYRFIAADASPTGTPLLLVSGTTSGNLVMYEVIDEDMMQAGRRYNTVRHITSTAFVWLSVRKNTDEVVRRTNFDAPAVKLKRSHYCLPCSMTDN